jgi:Right handed beta helix region
MLLLAGLAAASASALPSSAVSSAALIRVPQDAPTLQSAISQARPGDTILLDAGIYPGGAVVPREKHDLTIRGVDRNRVVLDGENRRKNGIVVRADGVSILNLSAHNFLENGLYWGAADRFRASYVTVWNVRGYGVYTEDSERGVLDHDYVSGAADAAYYVGECRPCDATLTRVTAVLSAVGYSGTNATGVVIRDSRWIGNGAGIVPNSYANEALPPQARTTIVGNTIASSGREQVPIRTSLAGFIGVGIAIAGGNENVVAHNRVVGSERYGIAVVPTARLVAFDPTAPEPGPPWRPHGNRVSINVVRGSGWSDLALAKGSGKRNCFVGNRVGRTLPQRLQTPVCRGASPAGDPRVDAVLARPVRALYREALRRRRPPSYTSLPAPPPQPNMRA